MTTQYAVKCDDCKATIRQTADVRESYQGGRCDSCRGITTETPSAGPWTAHDDDGTGTLPCVLAAQVTGFGNFYVAQCNNYADARLIAQTPGMIEALRELLAEADNGFHNPNTGGFALARQVVALAEVRGQ